MTTGTLVLPRYLDEPERFLCWTVDEAVVMLMPMVVGLLLHHSGVGSLLGIGLFALYHHIKTRSHGFYTLKGFLYWHGFLPAGRWHAMPPAWLREVMG
jgi:conjugal transfer pilus assembly protein TraL